MRKPPLRGDPLTELERQVMDLVVHGYSVNPGIERHLGLTRDEAYNAARRAEIKLGASTIAQAAARFVLRPADQPKPEPLPMAPKVAKRHPWKG